MIRPIPFGIKQLYIAVILLLPLTLSSCINDSMSDCDSGILLRFKYDLNDYYTDLFSVEVNHLDLYLYGGDGQLVEHMPLGIADLVNGNELFLTLNQGDYTAVVWGNNQAVDYDITCQPGYEDMKMSLKHDATGEVITPPGSLFHGIAQFGLRGGGVHAPMDVGLTKNTNQVSIRIIEKDFPSSNMTPTSYKVLISGDHASYNYRNAFIPYTSLKYRAKYTVLNTASLQADMTIMRMQADTDNVHIEIQGESGQILYSESLIEKIKLNPLFLTNEAFDRCDTCNLVYTITYDPTGVPVVVLISINGWDVIDGETPVG